MSSTEVERTQTGRYRWEALFLLCCAFFLHQADRAIFGVVLPLIKTDLQLTDEQLGLVATSLFFVLTVLIPISGPLADRYSRKWLIVGSLIFWSAATALTGFAGGMISLILLRSVATGGGEVLYTPAAYSLIAKLHPKRLGLALAMHQGALYLGLIAAGIVGGYIGQTYGWRATFYIFGIVGVVLGLWMAVRLAADPRDDVKGEPLARGAIAAFFRQPSAILLAIGFGGVMVMTNAYLVWGPEFMREKFGLSILMAGAIAMFAHHLGAFFGVIAGGAWSDKLVARAPNARPYLQAGALILAIPFILMMALSASLWLCCLGLVVFGFFRGVYESNTQASLFDVVEAKHRGTAWSLMVMLAFMIGSAAPWLTAYLRRILDSETALSTIFASYSAAYLMAALFLIISARLRKPAV
jgi:MFS family permease